MGDGLLMGLKAVAVAVVAHAVVGMASTLAPDFRRGLIVAAGAALALLIPGNLGQVTTIGVGLVAGLLFCRGMAGGADHPLRVPVSKTAGLVSAGLFAVLLMGLPLLAGLVANPWVATADAFYRSGALVFGGGHVVLPLLQGEPAIAEAVSQDQFLAGYGAAQAVPGPLFTFAAFLGFTMGTGAEAWLSSALALAAVFLPECSWSSLRCRFGRRCRQARWPALVSRERTPLLSGSSQLPSSPRLSLRPLRGSLPC